MPSIGLLVSCPFGGWPYVYHNASRISRGHKPCTATWWVCLRGWIERHFASARNSIVRFGQKRRLTTRLDGAAVRPYLSSTIAPRPTPLVFSSTSLLTCSILSGPVGLTNLQRQAPSSTFGLFWGCVPVVLCACCACTGRATVVLCVCCACTEVRVCACARARPCS
jgi:hypothetical protein